MSSNSFHLLGLLRSDQVAIATLVGVLVLILVVYFLVKRHTQFGPEDARLARRIAGLLAVIAIFAYLWHLSGLLFANRAPREDLDRTTIHRQMNENRRPQ